MKKKKTKEKPVKIPEELPKEEPKLEPLEIPVELKVSEPKGVPIIKAPIELPIVESDKVIKKKIKPKGK